jgi:hypothetical protein
MDAQELAEQLRRYEGNEAILRDKPLIMRVRIERIQTDGNSLTLDVTILPTPGLWTPPKRHVTLRSSWEGLSASEHSWACPYAGWRLYVDPEAIRAVTKAAADFPVDVNTLMDWADEPDQRYALLMRRYAHLAGALDVS